MTNQFESADPFADTKLGNALTRAIVDTIHEPFLVLDTDLRIIVASRSFYEKFKVEKTDTQGRYVYDIGNGQYNVPALLHFLRNIIPDHEVMKEYKISHDFVTIGQHTLLLSAREVVYENSSRKHILLTMGDITGQEELEGVKEKISQQKDLIIKEMKHRMANSLQLIASILILKSDTTDSLEAKLHLQDAHERIISIATVEKFLDTTSLNDEVEVGPYLTGLCESLAKSMIGRKVGEVELITLEVRSDGGMISSGDGISMGLVTAELVINALKHAFPDNRSGKIVVDYTVPENECWVLSVTDNGVGMSHDPNRPVGLGTTIVQSLARQLGAMVEIESSGNGTKVSITKVPKHEAPQLLTSKN